MGQYSTTLTPFLNTICNPFLAEPDGVPAEIDLPLRYDSAFELEPTFKDYASSKPEHAKVIISYFDFYSDKFIEPNAERRDFFVDLIKGLSLPRGSIFFWPCSHPVDGELVFCADLLGYCFSEFEFSSFVFFGRDLADNIHPRLFSPSMHRMRNFSLMIFPPFFTSKAYLSQISFLIKNNL